MPPFDDDLTDEERAELEAFENTTPPADIDDADPNPAPAPAQEPPAQQQAPADDGNEPDDIEAFKAKYAGKTPEELIQIAYAQSKRANKVGFEARQTGETLKQFQERARAVLEQKKQQAAGTLEGLEARRAALKQKIQDDPDAATAEIMEMLLDRDKQAVQSEVEAAEVEAQVQEALAFAGQYIPEFHTRAPQMFSTAVELGFQPEEVHAIRDGRQLVVLHLATAAANAMKAGLMDRFGNFTAPQPGTNQPTDPRLQADNPPNGFGRKPAPAGGARSQQDQLNDLLNMSDADLAKLGDEELMRITGMI
jgi:hypothetical protein